MDTEDLDRKIANTVAARNAVVLELDLARAEIVHQLCTFVTHWNATKTEHARNSYPDAINSLSTDDLTTLKQELSALDGETEELVVSAMDNVQLWPHIAHRDLIGGPHGVNTFDIHNEFEKSLDAKIRFLLGGIGQILVEHGIREKRAGYAQEWETTSNGVRLAFGFDKPNQLKTAITAYEDLFSKLTLQNADVKAAEHTRSKAVANDRWNQA